MSAFDPHARNTDPDTSHAASRSVDKTAAALKFAKTLAEIGPSTPAEVDRAQGYSHAQCWRRASDCKIWGWTATNGVKRKSLYSGRMQYVHTLTDLGRKMTGGAQ